MLVRSVDWRPHAGWSVALGAELAPTQLVLSFGPIEPPPASFFEEIATRCPQAHHVYVSGGGQISRNTVDDEPTVSTFVAFERATVHPAVRDGVTAANSQEIGASMGRELAPVPALRHVLVFAEGIAFNADAFLRALNAHLPAGVKATGGLASNGTALTASVVGLDGPPTAGRVVAVGLAGDSLLIGTGSVGGWDFFGPERIVTRADVAEVHELDGERALDVYKRYLGEFAKELPGSALLFPLAVRPAPDAPLAVRTVLGVDEASGSMRFAGDIPTGSTVRLMRTTTDKLVDGAARAAAMARPDGPARGDSLTLCVSCIGRRAVMRSRVEEEIEEVTRESAATVVVGFYSNGEIAPPSDGRDHIHAVLHNQTMTVTTIAER